MVADLLSSALAMGWMVTNKIKDKTEDQGLGKRESRGLRPTELSRESSGSSEEESSSREKVLCRGPEVAGKNDF